MKIHEQNKAMKRALAEMRKDLRYQRTYFLSAKFNRPDDYVRTHEILNRLAVLRGHVTHIEDLGIDLEDLT